MTRKTALGIVGAARKLVKVRLAEADLALEQAQRDRDALQRALGQLTMTATVVKIKKSKPAKQPRRAMTAAQKKAVSKRMKAYWAKRRAGK